MRRKPAKVRDQVKVALIHVVSIGAVRLLGGPTPTR